MKCGGLVAGLVIPTPLLAKNISPSSVDMKRSRQLPASHKYPIGFPSWSFFPETRKRDKDLSGAKWGRINGQWGNLGKSVAMLA